MKKIVSLLLALMLFVTFAVTAYATEAEEYFVIDDADILTDSEENTLDKKLAELSSTYQAQIIILTVDSLEGEDIDTYLGTPTIHWGSATARTTTVYCY